MCDIVATIQREQDEVVRLDRPGTLVIEGGPGTGKTAVALHRVAHLLYTRPVLVRRGVLVIPAGLRRRGAGLAGRAGRRPGRRRLAGPARRPRAGGRHPGRRPPRAGAHPGLRAAVDSLWPPLTPERLLADLWTSPARLDAAAFALSDDERAALHRTDGTAWTGSDAPLLDEAAELLGRVPTVRRQAGDDDVR